MPWANYPPKLKLLGKGAATSGFSTSLTVGPSNLDQLKNGPNVHLRVIVICLDYIYIVEVIVMSIGYLQ